MNKSLARWGLALTLLICAVLVALFRDRLDAAALEQAVHAAGAAAPLLFMALYALATLLFLPGSVLTLAGGALFGPGWGTLWNLTGAVAGAALAFLAARYLAADWVQRRLGSRLTQLADGAAAEGWRFVAFVRLVPLFPFNLLNYALGLTRIPFWTYVLASGIFMLPGALAYSWLGYAGREALAGQNDMIRTALIALALAATVAVLPRLAARLRMMPMLLIGEFKARLDGGHELLVLDVRSAAEFVGEQGHLATALNIPLEELPRRVGELDPRRPLALVCRTDRRSAAAARLLGTAGFAAVQVVQGGMTAWRAQGWPVIASHHNGGRPHEDPIDPK